MAKSKPAYSGWIRGVQKEVRLEEREKGKVHETQLKDHTQKSLGKNEHLYNLEKTKIPKLSKLEQHAQNLGAEIYDRLQGKYKNKANQAK